MFEIPSGKLTWLVYQNGPGIEDRRVYPNSMKSHDRFWGFWRFRLGFELGSSHSLIHQKDCIPQWRSHSKKKKKLWVTSERFRPRNPGKKNCHHSDEENQPLPDACMVSQLFVSRQLRTILCAIDQHLTQKRLQRSAKARSEKHFASWRWGIKIPRNSHLTLCQLCNSPLPWKRNTAKGNFQGEANATQIFKGLRRSLRPKPNFTKPGLFQPRLQAGHDVWPQCALELHFNIKRFYIRTVHNNPYMF